ncbi:TIGR04100 family radical SAM protein [Hominifimenecus sp. rT4P-3]|uniref:TIGR04100 family radical SAM protein n=1 Tax=Hominifimenecus sp. rT4P-3 TaxID=3242979 RepID=UPI003DA62B12
MTILYEVGDSLYINLTNKCPCACTFCLRQTRNHMENSGSLWLEHTPSLEEVLAEFPKYDMTRYREIVFCGFGEPMEALDVLLAVAKYCKAHYSQPIRINTNGLAALIHKKPVAPLLEGLIDTVSISLNTPNKDRYHELVRPKFGDISYDAMLKFAKDCTKYVPKVVLTTVETTLTKEEEAQCLEICKSIGAVYRIRPWVD